MTHDEKCEAWKVTKNYNLTYDGLSCSNLRFVKGFWEYTTTSLGEAKVYYEEMEERYGEVK